MSKSIRVAFYKETKKPINIGIAVWTWLFNPLTPPYSHVEIGFEQNDKWRYFSSTLRGEATGTRWIDAKDLLKNPERWDVYEVTGYSDELMIKKANSILGLGYDLAGILGFITPFGLPNRKNKWYCSEACYYVLTSQWKKRISPRRFYVFIKKKFKYSIRKVRI